jgi:hypothetical protein
LKEHAEEVRSQATHGHHKVVSASELNSVEHIGHLGTAHDQGGVLIDHRIPHLARHIITFIAGRDYPTTFSGRQFLDCWNGCLCSGRDVKSVVYTFCQVKYFNTLQF